MAFRFPGRWPEGDAGLNPLSEALERVRASGKQVLDLTVSNPTKCGLQFPKGWEKLLGGGSDSSGIRIYDPDPQGHSVARAAIAAYYNERDNSGRDRRDAPAVDPVDLFLTAGTSEGYSHLFKLLCGPGGHALIPRPSYPLLETLADLENVKLGTYALVPGEPAAHGGTPWKVDRRSLEAALTKNTRILFVVQPNNPTGSLLDAEDTAWLLTVAEENDLALVVDEVFADYTYGTAAARIHSEGPLVFTLNGLSKLIGLPQLKLAWIHVDGNATDKEKAKRYLEWLCDAYLSVGTASQAACAELLHRRAEFQGPLRSRLEANLATLRELADRHPELAVLWPQGGWCVPMRGAGIIDDEAFAIQLLEAEGVHIHPGYFFDFADFGEEDVIVLSLLPDPAVFREGVTRLIRQLSN